MQVKEVFRSSPQIYPLKDVTPDAERALTIPLGDLESGVANSALMVLVLPPRKPGRVRIAHASLCYDTPAAREQRESVEAVVTYTLDRAAVGKANGYVMNLVDQVSIAKLQSQAEAAVAAGDLKAEPIAWANRFWFGHHVAAMVAFVSLPGRASVPYQGSVTALVEEASWFILRGIGMRDRAIAAALAATEQCPFQLTPAS